MIRGNVERVAEGAAAERLIRQGYVQLGASDSAKKEEAADEKAEPAVALDRLPVAALRKIAKEKGITGAAGLTKKELLAILKG